MIRALLYRGEAPAYASFESDWVPSEYLADYYSVVELDERQTIDFFVEAIAESEPNEPVLFFGVGPALHHVFLAANKASEIHLGDYLQETFARSSAGSNTTLEPTTGVRLSATRWSAKVW